VAFSRDLAQGEYRFQIQSATLGQGQQLTIKTRRGEALVSDPVRLNVRGSVTDAIMGDLNGNGNPELYIFTTTSGGSTPASGVEAYEFVNRNFRPLQAPQKLSADLATGYMGQDKYVVQGNRLVRTFPIYSGSGAGSTPTGGTRTIEYSLNPEGILVQSGSSNTPGTGTASPTTTPPGQ
jgi:hypothetical protein